jgi:hypothetical protein
MAGDISAVSEFAVAMNDKPATATFGSLVAGVQTTLGEAPVIDKGVLDAAGGGGGTGTVASISPTPRSPGGEVVKVSPNAFGALSPIPSMGPGGGPR